jgi:hypothetical protein
MKSLNEFIAMVEAKVRCAFFDRFTFEDAIEVHTFAPIEALPCVRPIGILFTPLLTNWHRSGTVNSVETRKAW